MVSCESQELKNIWMTKIIDCAHMLKNRSISVEIVNYDERRVIPIEIPVTYMLNCVHCNAYVKKEWKRKHCGYCARLCCKQCCNGKNKLLSKLNSQMDISVCNQCFADNQNKKQSSLSLKSRSGIFHEEKFAFELQDKCSTVNFNVNTRVKDISAITNIDMEASKRKHDSFIFPYRKEFENRIVSLPPRPVLFQLSVFYTLPLLHFCFFFEMKEVTAMKMNINVQ